MKIKSVILQRIFFFAAYPHCSDIEKDEEDED